MRWREDGLWIELHEALRDALRVHSGKKKPPRLRYSMRRVLEFLTTGEAAAMMRERRYWAANERLVVDTLGFILGVLVTPANMSDSAGAARLLPEVLARFGWLRLIWADSTYQSPPLLHRLKALFPWRGLRLDDCASAWKRAQRLCRAAKTLDH